MLTHFRMVNSSSIKSENPKDNYQMPDYLFVKYVDLSTLLGFDQRWNRAAPSLLFLLEVRSTDLRYKNEY